MAQAWRAARGPFLILTPAVVALGAATAYRSLGNWPLLELCLVLVAALAAHVSVNAFNEAEDFQNGLDSTTARTPFSGGSGLLPAHPHLLRAVQRLAWGSLGLVMGLGAVLVWMRGWPLLVLGAVGVLLVLSYSRRLVRSPWGSLIAPGLAFGPIMVVGSHLALGAPLDSAVLWLSLLPFFGVNNLLLLNQLPDVAADRQVGRRNWPIAFGTRAAVRVYLVMLLGMLGVWALGWLSGLLPLASVWVLVLAWPAWHIWRELRQLAEGAVPGHQALGLNVLLAVGSPLLLAATAWWGWA